MRIGGKIRITKEPVLARPAPKGAWQTRALKGTGLAVSLAIAGIGLAQPCRFGPSCHIVADMALHHVNFHTLRGIPVFEQPAYDAIMRGCIARALQRYEILCPAWEVMPTHVHMIIQDFPDLPRSTIMNRIKGATAYDFLRAYPDLRADLLGGHLWAKGYFAVLIETHEQFIATLSYVRQNRERAELPPPAVLQPSSG